MEDGQTVTLTVTDVNGKQVTFTATVTDGKFSTTVDLGASGLADGTFTVKADVTDKAGNPATDSEQAILDSDSADLPGIDLAAIGDGNLSVAEAKAVELKGTTSNVEDGQTVTLTVTDVNGKQVTFTATVTDGKFSTTVDLGASGLADGTFTVKADVTDKAGNPATDSEQAILDSDSADLPGIDLAAIGGGNLSVTVDQDQQRGRWPDGHPDRDRRERQAGDLHRDRDRRQVQHHRRPGGQRPGGWHVHREGGRD